MTPYTAELAEEDLSRALLAGDLAEAYRAAEHLDELPPKPRPATVTAALWYASIGLPVFALRPLTKEPFGGTRGVLEATTDAVRIRDLFRNPTLNIGLATGHGIDVIDVDGLEGHLSLARAYPGAQTWQACRITPLAIVSTPRPGGLHIYVRSTGRGNRAGLLGKDSHVDYRGAGGYVVAPPSVTETGSYRFVRSLDPDRLVRG